MRRTRIIHVVSAHAEDAPLMFQSSPIRVAAVHPDGRPARMQEPVTEPVPGITGRGWTSGPRRHGPDPDGLRSGGGRLPAIGAVRQPENEVPAARRDAMPRPFPGKGEVP